MKQKMTKLELLFVVGLMVVLVVGLWGTSGSGLKLGSQVLASGAPRVPNGGGDESSAILATGTGTGKAMPALGANGQVAFWTGVVTQSGDNNLYWDNTNKRLGIGTTSPQRPLHLVGNICLFERNANSAGFIINRTGGASANRWVVGADEPTGFVIKTYPRDGADAEAQLVITKDDRTTPENEGRVGIGTTSPAAKLDVAGDTVISGNVGIGTTAPGAKLDVAGNIRAWGDIKTCGILHFLNDASYICDTGVDFFINSAQGNVYLCSPGVIRFEVPAGSTRMVVDFLGNVGIGTTTPNSKLQVAGPIATAYRTVYGSDNLTATDSVIAVDASSDVTITLPSASGIAGRVYTIKRLSSANTVTVSRAVSGSDTIDGAISVSLGSQYQYVTLVSNGVDKWLIVGQSP